MGKTATELREEIEERRDDLGRDFEAIGDRVSPARIAERKTEAVKSKFRGVKDAVMGTADDVAGGAHDTVTGVRESAHDLASSASDKVHAVADTAGNVPSTIKDQTQGNPLAAGLVAFGLGLLAASVLPTSRRERQLARRVEPQLQEAARTLADSGRGVADDLKPVVQEHAESLKGAATDAAHHVTDQAKDAAQATAEQAKQRGQQVTQQATAPA